MSSVRILVAAVAGVWAVACTQVHQLGQVDNGADSAELSTSTDDSGDPDDSSSTSSDASDETDGETGDGDGDGDGDNDDTSAETDDDESGETDGPIPDACDVVDLGGNEGVTIDIVLMNQWDAGACHEFYVTNETDSDLIWTRDLRFGGTLGNYWNAEGEELTPTDWRFGGQASASNIVVLAGGTVVFGGCMMCMP